MFLNLRGVALLVAERVSVSCGQRKPHGFRYRFPV